MTPFESGLTGSPGSQLPPWTPNLGTLGDNVGYGNLNQLYGGNNWLNMNASPGAVGSVSGAYQPMDYLGAINQSIAGNATGQSPSASGPYTDYLGATIAGTLSNATGVPFAQGGGSGLSQPGGIFGQGSYGYDLSNSLGYGQASGYSNQDSRSQSQGQSSGSSQSTSAPVQSIRLDDLMKYFPSLGRESLASNPFSEQNAQKLINQQNARVAAASESQRDELANRLAAGGFDPNSPLAASMAGDIARDRLSREVANDTGISIDFAGRRGAFDQANASQNIMQRGQDLDRLGQATSSLNALLGQQASSSASANQSQENSLSQNQGRQQNLSQNWEQTLRQGEQGTGLYAPGIRPLGGGTQSISYAGMNPGPLAQPLTPAGAPSFAELPSFGGLPAPSTPTTSPPSLAGPRPGGSSRPANNGLNGSSARPVATNTPRVAIGGPGRYGMTITADQQNNRMAELRAMDAMRGMNQSDRIRAVGDLARINQQSRDNPAERARMIDDLVRPGGSSRPANIFPNMQSYAGPSPPNLSSPTAQIEALAATMNRLGTDPATRARMLQRFG